MVKEIVTIMMISFTAFIIIGMLRAEKRGEQKLRSIPGLLAIDDAVKRTVEQGRPILFHCGTLNLASYAHWITPGISILNQIAKVSGEVGGQLITTATDPMLMSLYDEVIKTNYKMAGRTDEEIDVRYLSDSGFAYAAGIMNLMETERPGAHFLMATTMFEAIIVCEAAANVGAVQISGAAGVWQLPMMVASCDYCLIGEEYVAAGAILSGDLGQLGTIVGQDWCKVVVMVMIILGGILAQLNITWFTKLL